MVLDVGFRLPSPCFKNSSAHTFLSSIVPTVHRLNRTRSCPCIMARSLFLALAAHGGSCKVFSPSSHTGKFHTCYLAISGQASPLPLQQRYSPCHHVAPHRQYALTLAG